MRFIVDWILGCFVELFLLFNFYKISVDNNLKFNIKMGLVTSFTACLVADYIPIPFNIIIYFILFYSFLYIFYPYDKNGEKFVICVWYWIIMLFSESIYFIWIKLKLDIDLRNENIFALIYFTIPIRLLIFLITKTKGAEFEKNGIFTNSSVDFCRFNDNEGGDVDVRKNDRKYDERQFFPFSSVFGQHNTKMYEFFSKNFQITKEEYKELKKGIFFLIKELVFFAILWAISFKLQIHFLFLFFLLGLFFTRLIISLFFTEYDTCHLFGVACNIFSTILLSLCFLIIFVTKNLINEDIVYLCSLSFVLAVFANYILIKKKEKFVEQKGFLFGRYLKIEKYNILEKRLYDFEKYNDDNELSLKLPLFFDKFPEFLDYYNFKYKKRYTNWKIQHKIKILGNSAFYKFRHKFNTELSDFLNKFIIDKI